MSDSYEVQIMRQFQNMCAIIGGNSEYWNDVDMTNKANVSAYIQTRKNTQHLLDFLKQNQPAGHSENFIYEWTKAISLCERGEVVKTLKEAASMFGNDAYAFSFMMSMMKNIPLSVEEYQQIMEPRFEPDVVKECFESRHIIFKTPKHHYRALFDNYLYDYTRFYQTNFLDEFTERLKKVAARPEFAGHTHFSCLSESLEKDEAGFREAADEIFKDMQQNYMPSVKRNSNGNDYIRQTFPEIAEKVQVPPLRNIIKFGVDEFSRYQHICDILQEDAKEKKRYYDSRLFDDIARTDISRPEHIRLLADIFWQLNDRPGTYGSCYNSFYISQQTADLVHRCSDVEDWMWPILTQVSAKIMGDMPGSPKKLFDACKAWKISPDIWKKEAVMVGKMPLKARIVAGAIVDEMKLSFEKEVMKSPEYKAASYDQKQDFIDKHWTSDKELRTAFWEKMYEAQQIGWDNALIKYCAGNDNVKYQLLCDFMYESGRDALRKQKESSTLEDILDFSNSEHRRRLMRSTAEERKHLFTTYPLREIMQMRISHQHKAMNVLVGMAALEKGIPTEESKKFRESDASQRVHDFVYTQEDWLIPVSFKAANIFGADFPSFMRLMKQYPTSIREDAETHEIHKTYLSVHDAVYWLPQSMGAESNARFAKFIRSKIWYKNANNQKLLRPLEDIALIAQNWKNMEEMLAQEDRLHTLDKMKWNEVLAICRSAKYEGARTTEFATEAAEHGLPRYDYDRCESIYLASLKVPEPFDHTKEFKFEKYTGRFLPRNDPRIGFFGAHTNCCQHFGGVGDACAISSMKDPFSQLFVIEDDRGRILAGSWVWQNTEGKYRDVCFDNIEAIGEFDYHPMINNIYEQAAKYLIEEENCRKVTIGRGNQDASISKYENTEAIPLPKLYDLRFASPYTDAHSQVLLAENPNAEPLDKTKESVRYVREMCALDMDEMRYISGRVFPESDAQLQVPDKPSGLVVEDADKGVVGYILYDAERREIWDMAVLPEYRKDINASSKKLFAEMMRVVHNIGGEWSAEMRDKTTFRYLDIMAQRGLVKYQTHGIDHVMSDGSKVIKVTFEELPREAQSEKAKKDKGKEKHELKAKISADTENAAHILPIKSDKPQISPDKPPLQFTLKHSNELEIG